MNRATQMLPVGPIGKPRLPASRSPSSITLPWPPSVNTYWRSFRGRNILSEKGRNYKASAASAILLAGVRRVLGPCRLRITLYPPDDRRRDSDNYNKPIFDALVECGVIEADDSRIVRGHSVEWASKDVKNARAEVVVELAG